MAIILGIDPGSRLTGYGVVAHQGAKFTYLGSGCIKLADHDFPTRLKMIYQGITQLIEQFSPETFAIEKVFMKREEVQGIKIDLNNQNVILFLKQNSFLDDNVILKLFENAGYGVEKIDKSI